MPKIESFTLDHTKVHAPFVRLADRYFHQGVQVTKYDLRFTQPNHEAIPTAALHSLEHLLAEFMRENLANIIDLSPMGCRTGFYLTTWGEYRPEEVRDALVKALNLVIKAKQVPATTATECGNYRDHSLWSAQEYAKQVLTAKISSDPFKSKLNALH